ncbi:MAG: hypothetical protein JST79_01845 [Acidobacteria bacterium]|nr:hypothetical protein [Acidobacteriota bacterium]
MIQSVNSANQAAIQQQAVQDTPPPPPPPKPAPRGQDTVTLQSTKKTTPDKTNDNGR